MGLITILFIIFVVGGFLAMLAARWPISPNAPFAERVAWICWLLASLCWAYQLVGK
jgi:hypothetical protein